MNIALLSLPTLFEAGHDQLDRFDLAGLRDTIVQLRDRAPVSGPCVELMHAEVFETLLALHLDDHATATVHLQAAQGAAAGITDDDHAIAALALASARVQLRGGKPADAAASLEAGWPLAERAGGQRLQVVYALWLAQCFQRLSQWHSTRAWLERALQGAIQGGLAQLQLQCLLRQAVVHMVAGSSANNAEDQVTAQRELALARQRYDDAEPLLRLPQTAPYRRISTQIQCSLLLLLQDPEQLAEALAGLEDCRRQLQDSPDLELQVRCDTHRTHILIRQGDLEAAERSSLSALASAKLAGDMTQCGILLELTAYIAEQRGNHGAALGYLKELLALREQLAADTAGARAAASAVRLRTQLARAQAGTEQVRSRALTEDNASLRARAADFERDAQHDALTGAANRRLFDAHLATAFQQAVARQAPQCVALLDIDHFKRVNDVHGHAVGDRVLQRLVHVLQAECRDGDLVARLGGEEFAVVFHLIGPARAMAVCERMRAAVQHAAWHDTAPGLALTISIGMADIAAQPNPAAGLAAIDALLYEAKHAGRNQVRGAA